MLWLIPVLIAIIVLCILWWYGNSITPTDHDDDIHPTIHAKCNIDSCGGDLVCDLNCNRCKKSLNGDCSTDTDCESGLFCHEWKCSFTVNENNKYPNTKSIDNNNSIEKKKVVKWNDDKNETYFIHPRMTD